MENTHAAAVLADANTAIADARPTIAITANQWGGFDYTPAGEKWETARTYIDDGEVNIVDFTGVVLVRGTVKLTGSMVRSSIVSTLVIEAIG